MVSVCVNSGARNRFLSWLGNWNTPCPKPGPVAPVTKEVGLRVRQFLVRLIVLVTEAKVQREVVRHFPVVLDVSGAIPAGVSCAGLVRELGEIHLIREEICDAVARRVGIRRIAGVKAIVIQKSA